MPGCIGDCSEHHLCPVLQAQSGCQLHLHEPESRICLLHPRYDVLPACCVLETTSDISPQPSIHPPLTSQARQMVDCQTVRQQSRRHHQLRHHYQLYGSLKAEPAFEALVCQHRWQSLRVNVQPNPLAPHPMERLFLYRFNQLS